MKKIFLFTLFTFVMAMAFSEFTPLNKLAVSYTTDDTMSKATVPTEAQNIEAIACAYDLFYGGSKGELRYCFYSDPSINAANAKVSVQDFAKKHAAKLSGISPATIKTRALKDSDVKNEFNGDFAYSIFLKDVSCPFAGDWTNMSVDYFFKKDSGLVVRIFLFSDMSFMGLLPDRSFFRENAFANYYHSFKFAQ